MLHSITNSSCLGSGEAKGKYEEEEELLVSPVGEYIPAPAQRQVSERTDVPQLSQETQCQRITSMLTDAWRPGEQREARANLRQHSSQFVGPPVVEQHGRK